MINAGLPYYAGVSAAACHYSWQLTDVDLDSRQDCLAKFVSNKWFGVLVFTGIVADKLLTQVPNFTELCWESIVLLPAECQQCACQKNILNMPSMQCAIECISLLWTKQIKLCNVSTATEHFANNVQQSTWWLQMCSASLLSLKLCFRSSVFTNRLQILVWYKVWSGTNSVDTCGQSYWLFSPFNTACDTPHTSKR